MSTIAKRNSLSRSAVRVLHRLSSVQGFVRRRYWIWPLVFALLLAIAGYIVHAKFHSIVQKKTESELKAILNASVEAVTIWLDAQQLAATSIAEHPQVRQSVLELVQLAGGKAETATLRNAPALATLRQVLEQIDRSHGYSGFHVIDRNGINLGSERDDGIGLKTIAAQFESLDRVFAGESAVSRAFRSPYLLPDANGTPVAGLPVMHVLAPVRDGGGRVVAGLAFRIRPEADFTGLLRVGRIGETGETYAFDKTGRMISESRFDDQLREIGLLTDDAGSILNVELRDPGVNLVEGGRPSGPRAQQPLTRMAQSAIAGEKLDTVGEYRDYRGVPVVGAWRWLPRFGFGVATEIDASEAYFLRAYFSRLLWACFLLLAISAAALFAGSIVLGRLDLKARKAAIDARQLGQYTLEHKIGAGGMGAVYRAHHAMLRRPTAIKLLEADKTSPEAIARFEREVQLTSQLSHPNTVAIFDYGRTPEGVFYYAMELLEGYNLEELVSKFGPQPEARVVEILRQVCGSLAEAHSIGLIHRDVKPANILLTTRGGQYDVAKVLDFGLVKALDPDKAKSVTTPNALLGTPYYFSPEAIQSLDRVDARSDLYALGAVGYFLLCGKPVFEGESVLDICMSHVQTAPIPPSQRLGRRISAELEQIILQCLQKQPKDRPQSARELGRRLAACRLETRWSEAAAEEWWKCHGLVTAEQLSDAAKGVKSGETLIVAQG